MDQKTPKKVEKIQQTNHLSEIGQQNLTQFCLARYDAEQDRLVQCHQFVKCRDFMGDVWVGMEDNRDVQIYGFRFTKENPRPDSENCSLLLYFADNRDLTNFQENFSILKNIEDSLGWNITYPDIVDYPGKKRVIWIIGDKNWQKSAPAFALYSYLLKCLTYQFIDKQNWMQEIKQQHTNEGEYMDVEYMKFLLSRLNEINEHFKTFSGFKNQKEVKIGTIHNSTGFCAVKPLIFHKGEVDRYSAMTFEGHCLLGFKGV